MPLRPALPPTIALAATLTLAAVGVASAGAASANGAIRDGGQIPTGRPTAVVTGVVWDSIARRPLAGATVLVTGGREGVVTDGAGRFTVRGIAPGRQSVSAFHAALDSLGLAALGSVELAPGDSQSVVIASPSFETLWNGVCGADAPRTGAGIVFGTVRDAGTREALRGAAASLSWMRVDTASGRLRASSVGFDIESDSSGTYYACGVDLGREVTLVAHSGSRRSAEVTATLDDRRVARADVLIDVAAARGSARLAGTIVSAAGAPVRDATVRLLGAEREVRTDSAGRFVMRELPAGSRLIEVIALGYEPVRATVHLRSDDSTGYRLEMRSASLLPAVEVRARWMERRLRGVEDRKKLGFGKYLTGDEIRSFPTLRSAFASLPTASVTVGAPNSLASSLWAVMALRHNQRCVMNVLVDGRLTDWNEAREIPQHLVAAVEVYPRIATAPIELLPPSASTCGMVLIWTER